MREIKCGVCPRYCTLQINETTGEVSGNNCLRGPVYARSQLAGAKIPTKTVETSVLCADGSRCRVIATAPIPQWKYFDVMKAVKRIRLEAVEDPGTILLKDVCGTGADIVTVKS